jgi:hypothetical protein
MWQSDLLLGRREEGLGKPSNQERLISVRITLSGAIYLRTNMIMLPFLYPALLPAGARIRKVGQCCLGIAHALYLSVGLDDLFGQRLPGRPGRRMLQEHKSNLFRTSHGTDS